MSGLLAAERIDAEELARETAELVRVPSPTGDELAALQVLERIAAGHGLDTQLVHHDLEQLRTVAGFPGGVAERASLDGLTIRVPGRNPTGSRFLICAHVDVVPPGSEAWSRDPWSGEIDDGRVYGRGAVDMKGAVVAGVHALAAIQAQTEGLRGDVVLEVVASEEDGGQGAFAALQRDRSFAACLVPEPSGLAVASAHAGAIQFEGRVRGRTAHAANRLLGVSAIDRYIPLHQALADFETKLNRDVQHPLMRSLDLAYPVLVGRVEAGEWVSQVPDELVFQARVGVPVGSTVAEVWADVQSSLADAADDGGAPIELRRLAAFAAATTSSDEPLVAIALEILTGELGRAAQEIGVPWGADMQHVVACGIPCVMVGTAGMARAHAVDEWVDIQELVLLARTMTRIATAISGEH